MKRRWLVVAAAAGAAAMVAGGAFAAGTNSGTFNMASGSNLNVFCPNALSNTGRQANSETVSCAADTTTTTAPATTTTVSVTTTIPPTTTTVPQTTTTTVPSGGGGSLPGLAVSGNQILAGGTPIILRGANTSGTEFVCAQNWTTDPYGGQPQGSLSTFQAMAAWHINIVRIPLNEDCWLGINGVEIGGATYQAAIAHEVSLAHQAGLYVIMDLHWSAPGSQRALSQNPAPDEDHSVTFWQQVATAYAGDSGAIFDLYNEPYDYWGTNPDRWAGWLNGDTQTQYVTGGSPYTVTANWQTAGMQQLVNTVRSIGATNPILVNGLDWANDDSGWLSHAPLDPLGQIIAGAHIYPGESCATQSCWAGVYPAIGAAYPILVGETGDAVTTTSDASQYHWLTNQFFGYADAHAWSYVAWTWNVWTYADDVLITNWNGTPTLGEGVEWQTHLLGLP